MSTADRKFAFGDTSPEPLPSPYRTSAAVSDRAAITPAALLECPVSEAQRDVWATAVRSEQASCAFNESNSLTLEGPIDIEALTAALSDVVARYPTLRGSFGATGERMSIADTLALDLPVTELAGEPDVDAALRRRIALELSTPFDLANGPLTRAHLMRWASDKVTLILSAHRIVCDARSLDMISDELSQRYAVRLNGGGTRTATEREHLTHPSPLTDLADQLIWAEAPPEVEAFWLDQFKTIPALPELPTNRPRPAQRTYRSATYSTQIETGLYEAIKAASERQNCTLFATLFAAFQVLIGRLSDQTDVVIAIPGACRNRPQDSNLVGCRENLVPLRAPFDFGMPFADHLNAVEQRLRAAFDRQMYRFGALLQRLDIRGDVNRSPLTELQFNLEPAKPSLAFDGLTVSSRRNPKAFSNFDISFNVLEATDGLHIECGYNTDIFDEATIARWTGHFRTLLQAFIAEPHQAIGAMPLLTEPERKWLLDDLNATAAPFRAGAFLHQLIAEQAANTPDRIAAECAGVHLTHGQLDARANQLARHIRAGLPEPHGRVAVAVDRSLDMLVALIAVMKAGHTYVPLDPEHPVGRLRLVLETANVGALICNSDAVAALAPEGAHVIRLDAAAEAKAIASEDISPLPIIQDATTRGAYVIFTSGSTGTPKGVEVPHHAVVNFMASMAKKPGFTADDTIVAVTTVSFDIAALELYLPLLTGGRVVIASKDDARGGFGLGDLLKSSGASVLQATPSLWRILLETRALSKPGLKMLCGGEALPRDLADALIAIGGDLWNMYGPTETTIWSSAGRVERSPAPITIGEPIDNTQLYILDERDQIQPVGVPGHLYIGGDGLANGYFGRPDLTEQAFRMVSLAGRPAERIYRTGDLARRLGDGSIQMLGRIDQQVKLRGFRIELEEIEAALRTAPGIAAAAAAIRNAGNGEPRLIGYYIATPGVEPTASSLVAHLGAQLPDYMVPVAWRRLDSLPMTANGKLDRKALPDVTTDNALPPASLETARVGIQLQSMQLPQSPAEAILPVAANEPAAVSPAGAQQGPYAAICQALQSHPDVAAAFVIGRADGEVYGYIEPAPTTRAALETLPQKLMAHLRQTSPDAVQLSGVSVLLRLPRMGGGEINESELPTPVAQADIGGLTSAQATARLSAKIADIWKAVLGVDSVGNAANFFDLGGHSLLAVRMLMRLEDEFGQRFDVATLFGAPRFEDFVAALMRGGLKDRSSTGTATAPSAGLSADESWKAVILNDKGSGIPIISIDNIGTLYALTQRFGDDRPAICIRTFDPNYPYDYSRTSFAAIAEEYVRMLRRVRPHGPYILFGLCVHGVLAVEVARQLREAGEEVPLIAAMNCWEPTFAARVSRVMKWRLRFHDVGVNFRSVLSGERTFLQFLGTYSLVHRSGILKLARRLRLIKEIPVRTGNPEYDDFLLHLHRACDVYQPGPVSSDLLLFYDPSTPRINGLEETFGWRDLATGGCDLKWIPRADTGRPNDPGVAAVVEHLQRAFEEVDQRQHRQPTARAQL